MARIHQTLDKAISDAKELRRNLDCIAQNPEEYPENREDYMNQWESYHSTFESVSPKLIEIDKEAQQLEQTFLDIDEDNKKLIEKLDKQCSQEDPDELTFENYDN